MTKPSILFVCTGNIFRSVSAEYATRAALVERGISDRITVASAGTDAVESHPVHHFVIQALDRHGIDAREHRPTRLTRHVLEGHSSVVAMGVDHRAFMQGFFGISPVLFRELSEGVSEGVLDVHEAVPEYISKIHLAEKHVLETVDYIVSMAPRIVDEMLKVRRE